MSIARTIRTVRHLKPQQIIGQVRNRVRPYWENPEAFAQKAAPAFPGCRWDENRRFVTPGAQRNTADALKEGRFQFLNHEEALGFPPSDWNAPGLPKLWQYNLEYFEWLWAMPFEDARAVILDWIERHPLQRQSTGWDPYPISLRLLNWMGVCFGRYREEVLSDEVFCGALWGSVYLQTEWLSRHIETHLLGNHLMENGAALAFVGSSFDGEDAARSRAMGIGILRREIEEQILPDGMHFELSPMYHARMLYLFQLLWATGDSEVIDVVEPAIEGTQNALSCLCHTDGEIALLNDSAFGIYNAPGDLLRGHEFKTGAWALRAAGYYGFRGDVGNYIVCDAGAIGPDYIPGHAHADCLSFEWSVAGQRVIVDSGVYDYEVGPMRDYCRSTAAHNTVEIDGTDQCELWGAFRVGYRGYPRDVRWDPRPAGFELRASHSGYDRLPGQPQHVRTFHYEPGHLRVHDHIEARHAIEAASRFHIHPECHVELTGRDDARIGFEGGGIAVTISGQGHLDIEDSFYCPEFGRKEANRVLVYRSGAGEIEAVFTVSRS